MNLSVSNIAWESKDDIEMYGYMKCLDYTGLEIAPTRIFPKHPYEDLKAAKEWAKSLKNQYGFVVPSMQSIWFGRSENIFLSSKERDILIDYTKQAIDFAEAIGCNNLVFGCPRNRNIESFKEDSHSVNNMVNEDEKKACDDNYKRAYDIAISFFKVLGDYAKMHGTVLSMEANPPIYNTNFINETKEAIQIVKAVDSDGFKINLDLGTMIENSEDIDVIRENIYLINHVHISEPMLKTIEKRNLHNMLADVLKEENYKGFISLEMGKQETLYDVKKSLKYINEIFG